MSIRGFTFGGVALLFVSMLVEAAGGIESKVAVHKVIVELDGHEVLLPAKAIHPGDVLEYRITVHNSSEFEFNDVETIFPLPAGATFVKGTAKPADGEVIQKPRALRWIIKTLEPGAKVVLSARVRMT